MAVKQVENRADHLKGSRWKPGESGNPNGRPKKEMTIAHILRDILNEAKGDKTKLELVLENVVGLALAGERWAVEFIANRTEGTPVQTVRNETEAPEPIQIFRREKKG